MIRWSCLRTASLLGQRPGGVTPVERLALEDHLVACQGCRDTAALSDALRALVHAAPWTPRPAVVERAVARGLEEAHRGPPPVEGRRVGVWVALAGATVAAALLLVAGITRPPARHGTARTEAPRPVIPPRDTVAAGRVVTADRAFGPGEPLPADAPLRADGAAVLEFGDATVTLRRGGELRWQPDRSTVVLSRGSVEVAVDPRPGRGFRVATDAFVVEVVGTRFAVTTDEVRVFEGRVRVLDPGGALLQELGPQGRWRRPVPAAPEAGVPRGAAAGAPPPRGDGAAEHVARARRLLSRREVAAARRELRAALVQGPTRRQQADAATLGAECAFTDGDAAEALRLYVAVGDRFADLPAGESALFAAARLADRSGRRPAARALLRRYLDRYPHGQFHGEATARWRRLEKEVR